MDFLRTLLEQQPLMALFLSVAAGTLAGEIRIRGLSLGVGAVLFVALGVGWFAPKAAPAPMLGTFGLALFLYTVGIQYGGPFFAGLASARGLRANLLALIGVLASAGITLSLISGAGMNPGYAIGLFAGAGTSTPTLQAAIARLGNDDPAVGYSVAYPLGVAGPILFLALALMGFKPKIEKASASGLELLEVAVRKEHIGRRLNEVMANWPKGVRVAALRRDQSNRIGNPDTVLVDGDILLIVAPSRALLNPVKDTLGEAVTGRILTDRKDLDYLRVFVSNGDCVGRRVGDLAVPGRSSIIAQLRRGDVELIPNDDLILEPGDRVGLLAHRDDFATLRQFFGDSIRGTAEVNYLALGLGLAIGFLIGVVPIPLPGLGRFSLGLSSVLIVALLLGRQRRTAGLTWTLPLSANLVLRNLGLTVFLAQVGLASGPKFAATVAENGLPMLAWGTVVVTGLVVPVIVLGLFVFRMPFDEVAGVVVGATGNPAILAYANQIAPTEQPDLAYATTYPGMTIVKILLASLAAAYF